MQNNSLLKITQPFSNNIYWIQAGGGNTSIKTENLMRIKASGYRFDEMDEDKGFVDLDFNRIAFFFSNCGDNDEHSSKLIIHESILDPNGVLPSMETGFHAVLKKCVIHTHPILLNVFLCAQDALKHLANFFSLNSFNFVLYTAPGFKLSKKMASTTSSNIVFLQNHGLITHGDNWHEVLDIHLQVHEILLRKLKINLPKCPYLSPKHDCFVAVIDSQFNAIIQLIDWNKYLLPDQVVYLYNKVSDKDSSAPIFVDIDQGLIHYNLNLKNANACNEIIFSIILIYYFQNQLKLNANFLKESDVLEIINMSIEQYRQNILNS